MDNLEEFRQSTSHRVKGLSIFLIVFVILIVIQIIVGIKPLTGNEGYSDFVSGFLQGLSFAFAVLTIIEIHKLRKYLHDEKKFVRYYAECNDERIKQNCNRTASYTVNIATYILLLAAIIASLFNAVVFISILSCMFFICILKTVIGIIVNKTKYEEE